ncbi:MAG: sulfatase-like hydrolase/transferase [Planctomycetota bacterium]|jgi:choline-sulfatase
MAKPNIIFILSDQHNAQVAGYEGDKYVRTPNLDKLAESGSSLRNCYCGAPLCVPSRISLLTGLLPNTSGVYNNMQSLSSDIPTVAHSLVMNGYDAVLCGRMHFVGPDQRHGFTERLVGDITANRIGVANNTLSGDFMTSAGQTRRGIQVSGPGNTGVMDYDKAVLQGAIERIKEAKDSDKPLFMTVGMYGPHCPFVCPKELYDYYYDILPEPSVPENYLETCHPAVKNWFAQRSMLEFDKDEVKRSRAAYYGLVEITDRHVGEIVKAVEDNLDLENTVIIYASDHGDCIGHNGFFWKSNFYEGSARVPVIVSCPGKVKGERVITHPTSLIDLPATLAELTGSDPLPVSDGKSWVKDLTSEKYEEEDRTVFSMVADVKGDNPAAMVRRGNWKYIKHAGYDVPQLFNLKDDPLEQNDLGESLNLNAEHQNVAGGLQAELDLCWDEDKVKHEVAFAGKCIRYTIPYNETIPAAEDNEVWQGDYSRNYIEE